MDTSPPTDAPAASPSKKSAFVSRLFSTVVLWTLLAAAIVFREPILFYAMIGLVGVAALWEYFMIARERVTRPYRMWVLLMATAYFVHGFILCEKTGRAEFGLIDGLYLVMVILGCLLIPLRGKLEGWTTLERVFTAIFGFLYVVLLWQFVTKILFLPGPVRGDQGGHGELYILFLIAVTKFTDSGAYVTGSLIGKHKFIPHISPKKTWEGIIGAMFVALGVAAALFAIFQESLTLLAWTDVIVLGILLPVLAIVGDLAESVLKRCFAIKDSGAVLPGIGGLLDLIDSLLFTAPVFYFYLLWKQTSAAG